jgi:hypothetical protein
MTRLYPLGQNERKEWFAAVDLARFEGHSAGRQIQRAETIDIKTSDGLTFA